MANYYWVGGSGTWDNSSKTNWATSSGGAGGFGPPVAADSVTFDGNSGTAATVTVAATAVCTACTVNKSDINLSLSGSPTFGGTFTLTTGTVTLNNNVLTVNLVLASGSSTRAISFGTGNISVTGNNQTVWNCNPNTNFSISGTPNVNLTYSGATGTRTIATGAMSEANSISFNVTAGTDTFNITSTGSAVRNLNFTGFSGTWGSLAGHTVYGNLTISTGMTVGSGTVTETFAATSGIQKITTNGKTIDFPMTFNGVGGTFQLQDALTVGSTRAVTLTNGTLDAVNQNVTLGTFKLGSGTKTLTLGSGTWTVTGSGTAWDANTNVANLTVSASAGTISMTSGSAKTFAGGGKTWPTLNQGGAGALTIQQSNTFADITATTGGRPSTVTLTASTTQTLTQFTLSGTAGNLITLNTTVAGTQATLSDTSGTNSISYVSLKDINATGGALWQAYTTNGNVNAGNNTGWDFDNTAFRYIYIRRKNKVILPF